MPHQPNDIDRHVTECGRVLLVADETDYAQDLVAALVSQTDGGIRIARAQTLSDGLAHIHEDTFDIILLALDLPDSTGLDTAIIVLQQALDTPVIVIATESNSVTAWETTSYGIQDVLRQDQFLPGILLPLLNHAVADHAMRRSLERHIRELELTNGRFLSLVVDNADAIVVVDRIGIIRFVNPSAEKLLRWSAADLLGQMFGVPLEGVEDTEIELVAGKSTGRTAEIRVMKTLWDGERAYIVTMRDITDRKKTERALRIAKQTAEQASAMKSQFLANMSHELRTPLNSIIGFSELMLSGVLDGKIPEKCREYISDIHGCGAHLLSLINDLLDLSKAENGMLSIYEDKFDMVSVASSAVESMEPQAAARQIRLDWTASARSVWLRADERMMRQVLLNLVANAVKFTPPNGEVTVEIVRNIRNETQIKVRDTGIGIPREQIPRAFVAFVQVDNAYARTDQKGTGLGLALAKRFVEAHQGTIKIESDEGAGTTVTVMLPCARSLSSGEDGNDVVKFERLVSAVNGRSGPS